ncbi:hypothetical protein [Dictyobacter aurantiacus]|uniref:Uncharacterized protein n=1 Tax=Dictyobacter aurantiacus TaxID=1936993 RepID=A0A401ZK65_9CHLR|nr:hypothetical protein [Dictyobacter aurantiacus]GCE07243.1 hypothetical protein KDAU_45720 [Dictyobacter aurantiacus]
MVKDEWWFKAWQWSQFARYLRWICASPSSAKHESAEMIAVSLPYAAGFGLGGAWLRQFYLSVADRLPPWFTTSSDDFRQRHAAFEHTMYAAGFLVPKDKRTANYSAYR